MIETDSNVSNRLTINSAGQFSSNENEHLYRMSGYALASQFWEETGDFHKIF
jgi:hypothetical protein